MDWIYKVLVENIMAVVVLMLSIWFAFADLAYDTYLERSKKKKTVPDSTEKDMYKSTAKTGRPMLRKSVIVALGYTVYLVVSLNLIYKNQTKEDADDAIAHATKATVEETKETTTSTNKTVEVIHLDTQDTNRIVADNKKVIEDTKSIAEGHTQAISNVSEQISLAELQTIIESEQSDQVAMAIMSFFTNMQNRSTDMERKLETFRTSTVEKLSELESLQKEQATDQEALKEDTENIRVTTDEIKNAVDLIYRALVPSTPNDLNAN